MKRIILFFLPLCLVSLLIFSHQSAETTEIIDNEFNRVPFGEPSKVFCNPLLLNEEPLNYDTFNLDSKGELSLVSGNPNSPLYTKIPFYAQIRSQSSINRIADLKNYLQQPVYSIEVSNVLENAQGGDLLIITPSRPQDWKAKRILLLKGPDDC